MSFKFKPLFLIFIFQQLLSEYIYAQQHYDKYYTNIMFTEFLSDSCLNRRVEGVKIDLDLLNATIFHLTNVERAKAKLKLFTFYDNLYLSAQLHSESMIAYDFFNHINKAKRQWREPSDRVFHFDTTYIALSENIVENNLLNYKGDELYYRLEIDETGNPMYIDLQGNEIDYSTYNQLAKRLVLQWMNSKPHRENILSENYDLLGCACTIKENSSPIIIRCTQNFGKRE